LAGRWRDGQELAALQLDLRCPRYAEAKTSWRAHPTRPGDHAALDWVLGRPSYITSGAWKKHALGAAIGFLLVTARGIHTGRHDGVTHPLDYDRLVRGLRDFVNEDTRQGGPEQAVWGFVTAILALHCTARGILPVKEELPTFYAGAKMYRDLLEARRIVETR
jgi:hypothetical protein